MHHTMESMTLASQLFEIIKKNAEYNEKTNTSIFNNESLKSLVLDEPKKPKNPFFLFKEQNKDKIKESISKNSDFSGQGSFSAAASDIWKNMSLEERMPYENQYEDLKQVFINNKKIYDETFGRFNIVKSIEKPKRKRGRPRKNETKQEVQSTEDGYTSITIDGTRYELELDTNVIWTEDRDEPVGQRVGSNYEFY